MPMADRFRKLLMVNQMANEGPPGGRAPNAATNAFVERLGAQRAAQGGQPPQGYAPPRPMPMLPAQGMAARGSMLAQSMMNRGGPRVRPMPQAGPPAMQPQMEEAGEEMVPAGRRVPPPDLPAVAYAQNAQQGEDPRAAFDKLQKMRAMQAQMGGGPGPVAGYR